MTSTDNVTRISVAVCPDCEHITSRHTETTSLSREDGGWYSGTFIYTACADCSCDHYLDTADPVETRDN
ncbi:hypothetical protein PROPHIGD91-2_4 [Mycobacterium phage prophiGD91-2]|nr:hypothetical protein PROPHIGD91-2_4 [Mycobacterium phage prophiGD91-2]